MGANNSKVEEDKALQLCRARKKFVRQSLDGRCSLAATHVAYIQSLRSTGVALRKFVEPDLPTESSLYTSTSATPEPNLRTDKGFSHFSVSSPSLSHPGDAAENLSRSPTPPSSRRFQVNHMKFKGFSSRKVEEKPPVAVIATVSSSSSIPQDATPPPKSTEKPEVSSSEPSSGAPQWDYFQLFHPIDHEFTSQDGKEEHGDDITRLRDEEGVPELEDEEDKGSFHESDGYDDSEDGFDDDPPPEKLVRSYQNVNRVNDHVAPSASPTLTSVQSVASEGELLNREKSNSPYLSPLLRTPSSAVDASAEKKKPSVKEDQNENKVARKDFFSSMRDIEYLFIRASESGREVPRMLEANKLHFRPLATAKDNGSAASTLLKACFSCGEDPTHVQEEPAQDGVKYLTWHRTTSSRSSSSRNLLGLNSKDDAEDLAGNLFDNFCMNSGSHASTLDRLHAWERKLYDEVKASEIVRREYDAKCRFLRQLESKNEASYRIDKTRANVKDLHSRIRIAILRIDSISKRIEELRDKELQPQLEELIEGLSRMWEVMYECHKLQCTIISIANGNAKISLPSESRRQITLHLENELATLCSTFTKWTSAQKSYLKSINDWLFKCVVIPEKTSRRKKRAPNTAALLRHCGAPIYATCGVWLDKLEALPAREVAESIKGLAAETSRFIPLQERKKQGKKAANLTTSWKPEDDNGSDSGVNMLRDDGAAAVVDDGVPGSERFRSSLEGFLGQLSKYAELSVKAYKDVENAIQAAKHQFSVNSQSQAQTQ
ncbi:Protein ALTERED PHOSPHATE STARVATION RESPONSE 1 [Linum grandiflorum]